MSRSLTVLAYLLSSTTLWAQSAVISVDYQIAREHELTPHRRTVPFEGVKAGFNQLRLKLTVSPTGEVIHAEASGQPNVMKLWPELQGEVGQWRFRPFERNGQAVTATVEEYLDVVPPERLPTVHVDPPIVRPNSKVTITLERTHCYGSCPDYSVSVGTADGLVFDGNNFVVASGRHTDAIEADGVRRLAKRFVAADFYSMDASYVASVTDNPTYRLLIEIDGQAKEVKDYVGSWVGMPAIITELEAEVDTFARTDRWVTGSEGLVEALRKERYDFRSYGAQLMLKESASRGKASTVREFLEAGVPLEPLSDPKPKQPNRYVPFEGVGWLASASHSPEVLDVLIHAKASGTDQADKDQALAGAAQVGNLAGARALIAYGAKPNVDFSTLAAGESTGGVMRQANGAGSVLINAAESGNPEMVREILRYRPKLEVRNREGRTAVFLAGPFRYGTDNDGRAECLRLLAQAGADINARDEVGNTILHTIDTGVIEELISLGADVNARNKAGETPIFTTIDNEAFPLLLRHGADLNIRNNKGQTVAEAMTSIQHQWPQRVEAFRKAVEAWSQH